jgi:hypothetical protein
VLRLRRLKPRPSPARTSAIRSRRQQPDGDTADTPGVAAAPVALAGVIVTGVARFTVMLSAQADVFGVGTTVIVGSMLVPASTAIGD